MENKQAVAVAVGVGAVGTALAYLGYSVYNNNADIDNLAESQNNSWWANVWSNSNTSVEVPSSDVQVEEAIKEEDAVNKKIEKKEAAWPTFWKGEYDKSKNEKKDETSAEDYN